MKILVISPHPDDETLGAGGTILRAKHEGNEVYWLNITTIEQRKDKNQILERNERIKRIKDFYHFDGMKDLLFPTTRLDTISNNEGIDKMSEYIKSIEPQVILAPDYNDAHSDHRIVFQWINACTKSFRYPFVKCVLTMEILSETDFGLPMNPLVPNVLIDISEYIEQKLKALMIYKSEMGEHPFPRNIENIKALAHLRGSEAGVKYAEGFRMIKLML